jgi:antagonist of KipI
VRGGIAVPKTMGSASVHLMTGVGGRALRKGDVLQIGDEAVRRPRRVGQASWPVFLHGGTTGREACPTFNGPLRVTAGPQAELFRDELYAGVWMVSEESNRMGIRLRGVAGTTPIPSPSGQMITEGVPLGAIQVPPDGRPIVLFVEHQTTGGYPKPANVISADFWRLGQLRPRDEVRFECVTMEDAIERLRDQERWLYSFV